MLFSTKAKNPRTAFRGFFYSVLLWRLNPQAGHRLFITIQPFDDVTAGSILLPSFTTPVLSKVVSAAELYTDPKMEIWRGFQDSTHSNKSGNAAPIFGTVLYIIRQQIQPLKGQAW